MSVSSEITRIETAVAAAYTAASNKGATIPIAQNMNNLAGCISSISSGGLPATITAGDTPILNCFGCYYRSSPSLADSGLSLTIPRAGTWRIKWYASHGSGTCKSRLYLNGTAIGTQISANGTQSLDYSFAAGDVVTLYIGGGSYSGYALGSCLCACINWDIGL